MGNAWWNSLRGTHFEGRERRFRQLWLVAAATYGVGDIVTTIAILFFHPGVREANPFIRIAARSFGSLGVVSLKLAVFIGFILVSVYFARNGDKWLSYAPPVVLTVTGSVVTIHNLIGLAR